MVYTKKGFHGIMFAQILTFGCEHHEVFNARPV